MCGDYIMKMKVKLLLERKFLEKMGPNNKKKKRSLLHVLFQIFVRKEGQLPPSLPDHATE